MSDRQELEIVDGDSRYAFAIAPQEDGGKRYTLQFQPWEPNDGVLPWRTALHPWKGGLGPNRIRPTVTFGGDLANRPSMIYTKANADASQASYLAPPALARHLDVPSEITYSMFNTTEELEYSVRPYGTVTYMGAVNTGVKFYLAVRNFNGRSYLAGGQHLYSVNSNYELNEVKDFGVGKTVTDMVAFNNELVIAMGESEQIWTMSPAEEFTQSTEGVFAEHLGKEGFRLWRSIGHLLSNCIEDPLTLTSWVPTSGSEYKCGDSTYNVTGLIEAYGVIAAFKPDGVYFPNQETEFLNQTPQLSVYPHQDNGRGAFIAWGFLFVPSIVGLIRVDLGESFVVGPELSQRPDFRFKITAGIEWNRSVYLLCSDTVGESETFICKMMRGEPEVEDATYIYHEWQRLGDTEEGNVLTVYTGGTNPIMLSTHGKHVHYTILGRGGGPDIEDPNYEFGPEMEIESGKMILNSDLGMEVDIEGVKLVGRQVQGNSLRVSYDEDEKGFFTEMLSSHDGSGIAPIHDHGRFAAIRYARPNTVCNIVNIKISGELLPGTLSADRTEIDEAWLFGAAHPETVDILTIGVFTDRGTRVRGLQQGRDSEQTIDLFKELYETKKVFEAVLPGYNSEGSFRARIVDLEESNVAMQWSGRSQITSSVLKVVLRRTDFG